MEKRQDVEENLLDESVGVDNMDEERGETPCHSMAASDHMVETQDREDPIPGDNAGVAAKKGRVANRHFQVVVSIRSGSPRSCRRPTHIAWQTNTTKSWNGPYGGGPGF